MDTVYCKIHDTLITIIIPSPKDTIHDTISMHSPYVFDCNCLSAILDLVGKSFWPLLVLFIIIFNKYWLPPLKDLLLSIFEKIELIKIGNVTVKYVKGKLSAEDKKEKSEKERNYIEYKILNTLWTKQVNKYPDFKTFFTFKISHNNPSEQQAFLLAGAKLVGEGYIIESKSGQYYLSEIGFEYCKKHYTEFPPDQWWPEETINKDNLKIVLEK